MEEQKESKMALSLLKTTEKKSGKVKRKKMGLNIQQTTSHLKGECPGREKRKGLNVQAGT